jgi:hypothetical protein
MFCTPLLTPKKVPDLTYSKNCFSVLTFDFYSLFNTASSAATQILRASAGFEHRASTVLQSSRWQYDYKSSTITSHIAPKSKLFMNYLERI